MAQQTIAINLEFNANTSKAKAQMKSLQTQLNTAISAASQSPLGITPELERAKKSAMDLKIALNNATNVDTGKLNLNKFQAQLKASGRSIKEYAADMRALGPEGVQAFNQIANAVSQASTQLFSLQGGMKKLMNTFVNTVRWQVTATAVQSVTTAISETIAYAAELDKSLNNIQIVTGKSSEEMARFAKSANQAAKELSTATTKYTDAALIYYQQGLGDKAVKERTDTTVKLANVSGKTAAEVSEWMTAIWNNFDDGSASLSSYADTLAALGAATASSADEIAGGLEKFAAVAETVGLSYEYAAAALATITAETRQSEDVVGTALKTIFSRMESLKLGEALDDGTTLGQYSAQMEKVGVSIKDTAGNLKDMDVILNELGDRWSSLARDEQVALAQGVAGVRQYNQFISLMDNWDVMQDNVEIAKKAHGELEKQFGIYEDSAEAHKARMQASAETLKGMLLGGEDLKGFYSFMADLLEIITKVVDSLGGLPNILMLVGTTLMKTHQPEIASFFSQVGNAAKNAANDILHFQKLGTTAQQFKNQFAMENASLQAEAGGEASSVFAKQNAEISKNLLEQSTRMTEEARERAQWEFEILQTMQQQVIAAEKKREEALEESEHGHQEMLDAGISIGTANRIQNTAVQMGTSEQAAVMATSTLSTAVNTTPEATKDAASVAGDSLATMRDSALALGMTEEELDGAGFSALAADINQMKETGVGDIDALIKRIEALQEKINGVGEAKMGALTDKAMSEIGGSPNPLEAVQEGSDLGTVQSALSQVDSSQFTGASAASFEAIQQEADALERLDKTSGEYNERLGKLTKRVRTFSSTTKISSKQQVTGRKAIDKTVKSSKTYGKALTTVDKGQKRVEKSGKRLNKEIKSGGKAFQSFSKVLTKGITGITSFAMGFNMLVSSVTSFTKALKDGDADLTDWLTFLMTFGMGLSNVMPLLTSVASGITSVGASITQYIVKKKEHTEAVEENIETEEEGIQVENMEQQENLESTLSEQQETDADKAANDESSKAAKLNTVEATTELGDAAGSKVAGEAEEDEAKKDQKSNASGIMGIITNLGEQFSAGPAGWVTGAISLAAVLGLGIAGIGGAISIGKGNADEEEAEEDNAENNEKVMADYEAKKEATESHRKDAVAYEEALRTYKETGKEKEALVSAAEKAIEAYGLEHASLLLLNEDYDTLAKKIRAARLEEEKRLLGSAEAASEVQTDAVASAMRTGEGFSSDSTNSGQYTFQINWGGDAEENEDKAASRAIMKVAAKYDDDEMGFKTGVSVDDSGGEEESGLHSGSYVYSNLASGVDLDSDEEILNYYDYLTDVAGEMSSIFHNEGLDSSESEGYGAVMEEIYDMQNAGIEDLREIANTKAASRAAINVNTAGIADVKDLDEYWAATKTLEAQATTKRDKDALHNELASMAPNAEWETRRSLYVDQVSQVADDNTELKAYLDNLYRSGNMSDIYAASTIDFTKDREISLGNGETITIEGSNGMSVEEFEQLFNLKRAEGAKSNKIAVASEYEVTESQANAYSKALTENREDLEKFTKAGIEGQVTLENIAAAGIKANANINTLSKAWEENREALLSNDKTSTEYAYALGSMTTAFQDFLNTDVDMTDYVANNADAIAAFMNGEAGLYEALMMDAAATIAQADEDFSKGLNLVFSELRTNPLQLGDTLEGFTYDENGQKVVSEFGKTFNAIVSSGQYSKTQLNEIFEQMGLAIKWNGDELASIQRVVDNQMIETNDTLKKARKEREENLKALNEELSRYHEIERIQSKIERVQSKISEQKERAYGKDKIAAINAEVKAYEASAKAQKERARQAELYLKSDKQDLQRNFSGLKFDEKTGNITNYTEIERQLTQDLANISDINSERYQEAEQRLQDFRDMTAKYEESQDILEEAKDQEASDLLAALDAKLEEVSYTVEINLEVNERQLAYLERKISQITDDEDKLYTEAGQDNVSKYREKAVSKHEENIATNEKGIRDLLGTTKATKEQIDAYMNGDASAIADLGLTEEQMNQLKTYTQNIADENDALREIATAVEEDVLATHDYWRDKMSEESARLDNLKAVAENYKSIAELTGNDDDEYLKELEQAQLNADNERLAAAKTSMETTQQHLDEAKAALATAGEDERDFWETQVNTLEAQLLEDQETFTSTWSECLQNAADIFEAQMERTFDDLDKRLAGSFDSLAQLSQSYEQQQEIAERYLDNGEKLYNLSKLNRKIQQDIDNSTSIKGQRELAELQEMINAYQQDGVNMSKADLDALQKRYDLKVAEIALEEAQNAKSQVRLTRNAEGGMSYVYTADETNIAKAEQKYEDTLEANRALAEQQSRDLTAQIISNRQAMVDALREIRREDYDDVESYQQALMETQEYYQGLEAYLLDEKNKTIARSQIIYAEDFLNYKNWSVSTVDASTLLKDSLAENYNGMGQNSSGWVTTFGDHMTDMCGNYEAVAQSAADLNVLLGNAESGVYNEMILGAAAWVSALGTSQSTAAAQYSLIVDAAQDTHTALGDGVSTGTYGHLLASASSYSQNLRTTLSQAGGIYGQISDALDLVDQHVGTGAQDSTTSYGLMLTHAELFGGNLEGVMKTAGGYADYLISGANGKGGISAMVDEIGSVSDTGSFLGKTATNLNTWVTTTDGYLNTAGTNADDLKKTVSTALFGANGTAVNPTGGVSKAVKDTGKTIEGMKDSANKGFTGAVNTAKTQLPTLNTKVEESEGKVDALNTSLDTLDKKNVTADAKVKVGDTQPLEDLVDTLGDLTNELSKLTTKTIQIKVNVDTSQTQASIAQNSFYRQGEVIWDKHGYKVGTIDSVSWDKSAKTYKYQIGGHSYKESELKNKQGYAVAQFATGGYTGEWGPDGRFALLHQKEIVLNAHDTENLLSVVEIVRQMASTLDLNAMDMFSNLNKFMVNSVINMQQPQAVDQNVTITAEFPNATNRDEIKEAFGDLVNLAAQYASRR